MGKFPAVFAKTFVFEKKIYTLRYSDDQQVYVFQHNIQNNALHLAAYMGDIGLMKAALASPDADINASDTAGNTPLHSALQHGHADVAIAIFNSFSTNKSNVFRWEHQNKAGETVLHLAAKQKSLSVIERLLAYKQTQRLWEMKTVDHLQPLEVAVMQGSDAVACYLWVKQPKAKKVVSAQFSYTCAAIKTEKWGLLEQIIKDNPKYVLEVFEGDKTLLHIVAQENKPRAAEILKKGVLQLYKNKDIDVKGWLNCQTEVTKVTALHSALLLKHLDVVDVLITQFSELGLSVDVQDVSGSTCLHTVSTSEDYSSVFLLVLKLAKNLNIQNHEGLTPLYSAVQNRFFMAAYILLSSGLKVSDPKYPCDLAIFAANQLSVTKDHRFKGFMRIVAQQHTNVWDAANSPTERKERFFKAVTEGDLILLEYQYKIPELLHLKNTQGLTALHCAIKESDFELVLWLLQNGAPVNACTTQGSMSPLYLAGLALLGAVNKKDYEKQISALSILKEILKTPGVIIHERINFLTLMPQGHEVTRLVNKIISAVSMVTFVFNSADNKAKKIGFITSFGSKFHEYRKKGVSAVVGEAKALLGLNAPYMQKYGTLLQNAVFQDDRELVKALLDDPEIDVNIQDIDGDTVLHTALLYQKKEIVDLLLAHPKIRADIKNYKNEYPLHYAPLLGFNLFERVYHLYPDALYKMSDDSVTPQGRLFDGGKVIEDATIEWLQSVEYSKPCVFESFPLECMIDGGIKNPIVRRIVLEKSSFAYFDKRALPLHRAIHKADVDLVREILARDDVDINIQDEVGNTALHVACFLENEEILTLLLQKSGIVADIANFKGQYPLHFSCKVSFGFSKKIFNLHPDAINIVDDLGVSPFGYMASDLGRRFLKKELDGGLVSEILIFYIQQTIFNTEKICHSGLEPLIMAVGFNLPADVVAALLPKSNVNAVFNGGNALQVAIDKNNIEAVRVLLTHQELDVNVVNALGNTPLHLALIGGFYEIAELLLQDPRVKADIKNNQGQYALHYARICPVSILKNIFYLYPDAIKQLDDAGCTPFGYILGRDGKEKTACLSFLLDRPELDLSVPCVKDSYAIHLMAAGLVQDYQLQRKICDRSDVNVKNDYGLTAFHYAVDSKNITGIHVLLNASQPIYVGLLDKHEESALNKVYQELDADTELPDRRIYRYLRDLLLQYQVEDLFKDQKKRAFLLEVIKKGNTSLISDSDLNLDNVQTIRDPVTGYTLLHLAVIHNRMDLVQKFNQLGFSINAIDAEGRTPLHHAASKADVNMLLALLSRKYVNVGLQDKSGKTALDLLPKEDPAYQACYDLLDKFKVSEGWSGNNLTKLARDIFDMDESPEDIMRFMNEIKTVGVNVYISEHMGTAVHAAIKYQKYILLRALMEDEFCDLNAMDGYARSPLMYAVELGDVRAVSFLTNCERVSVMHKDESDFTGLHVAVLRDKALRDQLNFTLDSVVLQQRIDSNMISLQALLKRGANPYFPNEEHKTPFYFGLNNPKVVKAFLESRFGLDRVALARAFKEYDLLHCAVQLGKVEVIDLLLSIPELLPLLNTADLDGEMPFHYAIDYVDPEVFALLWSKGKEFINIDLPNRKGVSWRDIFVQYKGSEMEALWATITADLERKRIRNVSDIKVLTVKQKLNALKNQLSTIKTVEDVDVLKDLASPHNKDWKASGSQLLRDVLHILDVEAFKAAVSAFGLADYAADLVEECLQDTDLQKGLRLFSIIPSGKFKNTLLYQALQFRRLDILQEYMGLDFLKSHNQDSKTPAEIALMMGDGLLCRMFLDKAEQLGMSFLEVLPLNTDTLKTVVINGEVDILNAWLKAKGHKRASKLFAQADKDGNTPLHLACISNHSKIVEVVLKFSTHDDVYRSNKDGQTVMQLLLSNHPDIKVPKEWTERPFDQLNLTEQLEKIKNAIVNLSSVEGLLLIQQMLQFLNKQQLKKHAHVFLDAALQVADLTCFNAVVDALDLRKGIPERWKLAVSAKEPVADRLLPFVYTQSETKDTVWHQAVLAVQGLSAEDIAPVFLAVQQQSQFKELFFRTNQFEQTPIMLALKLNNWHVVNVLLDIAAVFKYSLERIVPPTQENLLQVMAACKPDLLARFLNEQAYQELLEQKDTSGNTLLHVACKSFKHAPIMLSTLLQYVTHEALHQPNELGETVIQLLAESPDIQIPADWAKPPFHRLDPVTQLQQIVEQLNQGANLNVLQSMLSTLRMPPIASAAPSLLHEGVVARNIDFITMVLQSPQYHPLLKFHNIAGQTPLSLAVQLKEIAIVTQLMHEGLRIGYRFVDLLVPSHQHLLSVIELGDLNLLEQCLSEPAYVALLQQVDEAGYTPLQKACLLKQIPEKLIIRLLEFYTHEAVYHSNTAGQTIAQSLALVGLLPTKWQHPPFNAAEVEAFLARRYEEAVKEIAQQELELPYEVLCKAIQKDKFEDFVEALKKTGIDWNQPNAAGEPPLHQLIYKEPEWLMYWLSLKLPTTAVNRAGDTALLSALKRNRKRAAELLVQAEDAPVNIGYPLDWAVQHNYVEVLTLLLQRGADPEHATVNKTLLELIMARSDRSNLMGVLVEQVKPALLDSWNVLIRLFKEWRPRLNLGVFSKLIKRGINLNVQDPETGNTALHFSFLPGTRSPDTAQMLLETESLEVNLRNNEGVTPGTLFFTYGADHLNFAVQSGFAVRGGEARIMFPPNSSITSLSKN